MKTDFFAFLSFPRRNQNQKAEVVHTGLTCLFPLPLSDNAFSPSSFSFWIFLLLLLLFSLISFFFSIIVP